METGLFYAGSVIVLEQWRCRVHMLGLYADTGDFYFETLPRNRDGAEYTYLFTQRDGLIRNVGDKDLKQTRDLYGFKVWEDLPEAPSDLISVSAALANPQVGVDRLRKGLKAWGYDMEGIHMVRNYLGGIQVWLCEKPRVDILSVLTWPVEQADEV